MESLACNIVVLPEPDVADRAIRLSRQLQQFRTLIRLEDGICYPHVSLYMVQLKVADLPHVGQLLAGIAARIPQLTLTSHGYAQDRGYFDAEYARTGAIGRLQDEVLAAVNPLRDGLRVNDQARLAIATGQEAENLRTYGYRGVGPLFRPHLTITRFSSPTPMELQGLPDPQTIFSGLYPELGLFEMGENGTCVRVIGAWSLAPIAAPSF